MDGYFWLKLGKHFLLAFFPVSFFLRLRRKKKLTKTQSMKTQVKSGEIPVHKNVGKMKQNIDSRRLTPKSAKSTFYLILKIHSRESTGKFLKISKTGMADRWVLVQVKNIYQPSGMWDNLISDSWDVGLVTWTHINGFIDACKCTEEIFSQQFLNVENQND